MLASPLSLFPLVVAPFQGGQANWRPLAFDPARRENITGHHCRYVTPQELNCSQKCGKKVTPTRGLGRTQTPARLR